MEIKNKKDKQLSEDKLFTFKNMKKTITSAAIALLLAPNIMSMEAAQAQEDSEGNLAVEETVEELDDNFELEEVTDVETEDDETKPEVETEESSEADEEVPVEDDISILQNNVL